MVTLSYFFFGQIIQKDLPHSGNAGKCQRILKSQGNINRPFRLFCVLLPMLIQNISYIILSCTRKYSLTVTLQGVTSDSAGQGDPLGPDLAQCRGPTRQSQLPPVTLIVTIGAFLSFCRDAAIKRRAAADSQFNLIVDPPT